MPTTKKTQFFAYIQMTGKILVYQGDLQAEFGFTLKQEQALLSKLALQGLIIRLKRGIYLVPQKLPPGGKWQPNSLYIISHFMALTTQYYYIGGHYAFNHYGLSEQIPNTLSVYNDTLSGERKFGVITVKFFKVSRNKLKNPSILKINNETQVNISSLTRTLLDAVMDWNRYGTLPKAYFWIKQFMEDEQVIKQLISETKKYGNLGAKKRIGYVIYKLSNKIELSKPLLTTIKKSKALIPLDPNCGRKGSVVKDWGVIDNAKFE